MQGPGAAIADDLEQAMRAMFRGQRLASGPVVAALLLAVALLAVAGTLAVVRHPEIGKVAAHLLSQAAAKVTGNVAEYLFFVGTTFLALLQLQQRRWKRALLVFVPGIAWLVFHRPVSEFIDALGVDSFAEAKDFDLDEAVFWLTTLGDVVRPNPNVKLFALYGAISLGTYAALHWLLKQTTWTARMRANVASAIALVLIGLAVHQTASRSVSLYLSNSADFLTVRKNFSIEPPPIEVDQDAISVLVYIGESTSILNMGLYGYPRDTTPRLSKLEREDPNLLVFRNVFSTHTHTSQSLLEALSFAIDENENFLPITERRRLSVVDALNAGGVRTTLVSNQGMTGTWNQASSIVFRNAHLQVFSTDSRIAGNRDSEMARPWDHDFFARQVAWAHSARPDDTTAVFFHSYAGHGKYLENIPESFRKPVDDTLANRSARSVIGADAGLIQEIDAYDSAVRYIDHAVAEAIEFVKALERPTVFVYFSDHGEAVYAGRAHDSARFTHEMARVPLLAYFNEAARRDRASLYEKYARLARQQRVSTLAQLPATILDLIGAKPGGGHGNTVLRTAVVGEDTVHPPIVVRETAEGITFVNINRTSLKVPQKPGKTFIDKTDEATRVFVARVGNGSRSTLACYEPSSAPGDAIRGSIVASCLTVNLASGKGADTSRDPWSANDDGLRFGKTVDLALRNGLALWIDSDLPSNHACQTLRDMLDGRPPAARPILVNVPAGGHRHGKDLLECVGRLGIEGLAISYDVPKDETEACARAIEAGRPFDSEPSCLALREDLRSALHGNLFSGLTFDYANLAALEGAATAAQVRWNARRVPPDAFDRIAPERFGMVHLGRRDPED